METPFPYVLGRPTNKTDIREAMHDMSQDDIDPPPWNKDSEDEHLDEDAEAQDFVFPNLEQDLTPNAACLHMRETMLH